MRAGRSAICVTLAATLAFPSAGLAAGGDTVLNVTSGGSPVAGLEVALNAANRGKVPLGTTNAKGDVSFALDAANLGKARVEVVSEDCPKQDRVWLVGPGGQLPPPPRECKRRVLGAFFWGADHVKADLAGGVSVATTGKNPYFKPAVALTAVGGVLTIFSLVSKKNICDGQDLGPSCNETRTGLLITGLVLTAGGVVLWRVGKSRAMVTELAGVPGGGVALRTRVRF